MTTPDITRTAGVFVSGLGRAPALTKLTRAALAWALKLTRKAVVVLTLGMVIEASTHGPTNTGHGGVSLGGHQKKHAD